MIDRVGKQLGNYRITQVLGSGGFAEVYLGEHVYLKTLAAVKVLYTRLSVQDDLESFIKEAQTIARLTHPNIVRVLDFGVDNETPFLVMDYAPNGTLRQRHPKGSFLTLEMIIPYVRQIADALQYAHDERFIHRDIKPENMLIGRRNEILLSDFGIALAAQSSRNQNTQDVTGTVSYMAPEQIQGKPRPASDQYALGIVVYEWLSGSPPFKGSFTELCVQHMYAEVPPLHEKVPTLSKDVAQVVMTTLEKDYKQRFGSISAFARALEQAAGLKQGTGLSAGIVKPSPSLGQEAPSDSAPEIKIAPSPVQPITNSPNPQSEPVRLSNSNTVSETKEYDTDNSKPTTEESGQRERQDRKPIISSSTQPNAWGFSGRQILATLIGLVIFGTLNFSVDELAIHVNADYLYNPIGGSGYLPSVYGTLLGLQWSVVLFFAAEFGPWTALSLVLISGLLIDLITGYTSSIGTYWYIYVSGATFAFFPALAYIRTRGNYTHRNAIWTFLRMSLIGIGISVLISVIGDTFAYHNQFLPDLSSTVVINAISLIVALLLIPFFNRRRASAL